MKRRIFSITAAVGLSLALVFGFGGVNVVKAAPNYTGGEALNPPAGGAVNLIGADQAANSVVTTGDRDFRTDKFAPDTYGLRGTLRP